MLIFKTFGNGWEKTNCKYVQNNLNICLLHASPHNLKNNMNDHPVSINNMPIVRIHNYSCLGVNLDERLFWGSHIDYICSKVGAGIGLIRRTKPFVSPSTLKMLCNALFYPTLITVVLYGITVGVP